MDIQQTDKESLATYVHRFKWEANRCKFNNDAATLKIFLKGLKNMHTIATKVYERGPQTLSEVIREVEKLQAAQQITSSLLPTSSVNTMSRDNDRCFQCQEVGHMARYCPNIRCYDCDSYGHVAMDCPDKIPPSGMPAHHSNDTNDRSRRSSSRHHSHNRCSHHENRDRSRFTRSQSQPHNHSYRSGSHHDPHKVAPGHFTDLPIATSHVTEAPVPTVAIVIHPTTDPHLTGTLPGMTADPDIGPGNISTNQTKDIHPLHGHHPGNTRTEDTIKSQLMTHHWNIIAQTTMTATLMRI